MHVRLNTVQLYTHVKTILYFSLVFRSQSTKYNEILLEVYVTFGRKGGGEGGAAGITSLGARAGPHQTMPGRRDSVKCPQIT